MAGERTYSDKEFALILKKAAKLSGTAAAAQSSPRELTLDEMKAIAAEAGLDPALIERAAHFLPRVETSLGGWGARKVSASFPLTLTREQTEQLLSMLNATLDHPGVGEATSSGLAWRGSGFGAPLVTMHREGRTHPRAGFHKPCSVSNPQRSVGGHGSLDPGNYAGTHYSRDVLRECGCWSRDHHRLLGVDSPQNDESPELGGARRRSRTVSHAGYGRSAMSQSFGKQRCGHCANFRRPRSVTRHGGDRPFLRSTNSSSSALNSASRAFTRGVDSPAHNSSRRRRHS
jgi:hypothetical protein